MGGLGDVRVMWRKMLRIEDYKGGGIRGDARKRGMKKEVVKFNDRFFISTVPSTFF